MRAASLEPVTALLKRWRHGDSAALEKLQPLVYSELRRIAARQLRRERPRHTLQPTALVHEVYLKLVDQHGKRGGGAVTVRDSAPQPTPTLQAADRRTKAHNAIALQAPRTFGVVTVSSHKR